MAACTTTLLLLRQCNEIPQFAKRAIFAKCSKSPPAAQRGVMLWLFAFSLRDPAVQRLDARAHLAALL